MNNDYDAIAPFYDRLARAVFGNSQREAQIWFLDSLQPHTNILIAGGGTGWILEEIGKRVPAGMYVCYVEKSTKMLDISKRRWCGENQVEFICSDVTDLTQVKTYDAIITGFLFDNFNQQSAEKAFCTLDTQLKIGGIWLYTDFEDVKRLSVIHRLLLNVMYWFFRKCCKVEASKLPDVKRLFKAFDYKMKRKKSFFNEFIASYIYLK